MNDLDHWNFKEIMSCLMWSTSLLHKAKFGCVVCKAEVIPDETSALFCLVQNKWLVRIHYPIPMLIAVPHLGHGTNVTGCFLLWVRTELTTAVLGNKQVNEERPSSSPVAMVPSWFSWETCPLQRRQFLDIFFALLLVVSLRVLIGQVVMMHFRWFNYI